ncbi:MAG: ATP-binding protein [Deltaproteobacteria bacterium]|nr:ATP-binding protein [Deltaproteobacteria bacterium]
MSPIVSLTILSDPILLRVVRAVVDRFGDIIHFSQNDLYKIKLALDEVCTNVIRHSYDGHHDKPITIDFYAHPDRLEITIKDQGRQANEMAVIKEFDQMDKTIPGGLGLPLIKSLVDHFELCFPVDDGNISTLIKYFTAGD